MHKVTILQIPPKHLPHKAAPNPLANEPSALIGLNKILMFYPFKRT